jgi:hypothetical protein
LDHRALSNAPCRHYVPPKYILSKPDTILARAGDAPINLSLSG